MQISVRNSSEFTSPETVSFLQYRDSTRKRRRLRSCFFVIVVLIPVIITAAYAIFIAAPLYKAEARFAIRGGEVSSIGQPGLGSMLGSGTSGIGLNGFVDGYAVRDFLQSRKAMEIIDARIGLKNILRNTTRDPFAPAIYSDSADEMFASYSAAVSVHYNMIEQIVVLNVLSFRPQDSVMIARGLLAAADEFADSMNRRALEDAMKVAQAEVGRSEQRTNRARAEIARWRQENATVDPLADVTMVTAVIGQLESQLSAAEADLQQLLLLNNSDHPRRRQAEGLVDTLKRQIADTRRRLGGRTDAAAGKILSFTELRTEQEFAEANLASARQSLEQARVSILRQQRYVLIISEPIANSNLVSPNKMVLMTTALLIGLAVAFFGSIILVLVRSAFG